MQVLDPITVTEPMVITSNIPEDDYPEWGAATDYAIGDRVISLQTYQIYQALAPSGPSSLVTNPQTEWAAIDDRFDLLNTEPVTWDRLGSMNALALFDQSPTNATSNPGAISLTLTPATFVEGLAFFNLSASELRVRVEQDDVVRYDRTVSLADNSAVVDWLSYFLAPIRETEQYILTDLPPFGWAKIHIDITRLSGVASVGEVVPGTLFDLGKTRTKPKIKLLDYSKIEEDQYGNLTTTVRGVTQEIAYEFWITGLRTEEVLSRLKTLRGAKKAVWIGDDESRLNLINYGYMKTLECELDAAAGQTRANTFAKILTRGVL